jgi:hypothetical protein
MRHRPAAHQLHTPHAVDPPRPAPRLAPPSAPRADPPGSASDSPPRTHHYGARVCVVSLDDTYLCLSSRGTQNGLCV